MKREELNALWSDQKNAIKAAHDAMYELETAIRIADGKRMPGENLIASLQVMEATAKFLARNIRDSALIVHGEGEIED